MLKIVYSFNKTGYEADCWNREIAAASDERYTFIPFNHEPYLDPYAYYDSVKLDQLYQARDERLMRMYRDFEACLRNYAAEAVIVNNCPPYHPDFLRRFGVYKVLYSTDDPGATYMRTIPYVHAYDHVLFVSPSYSRDMDLEEKMRYCGTANADWLPISVFDFEHDPSRDEGTILAHERDIDIVYVGAFFRQKLPLIARIRKTFGARVRIHGFFRAKHNLYFMVKHGYPGWVRPVSFEERVKLYQRSKIGFNIHWNEYGIGNQRLFHLPANGVMQICDCPKYIDRFFEPEREIVGYESDDDLVDKVRYFLDHEEERKSIALQGYRRTMRDYRFATITRRAGELVEAGMARQERPGSGSRRTMGALGTL